MVMIQKGNITHKVCEGILTWPSDGAFTSTQLWESLVRDYPEIKKATVSALLTSKKSAVRNLIIEQTPVMGRTKTYTRNPHSVMPSFLERKTKPKYKHISGFDSVQKTSKSQPIPETVTDHQIGQSIILYIDQLKEKVKCLASAFAEIKARKATEERLLKQEVARKEDTIKKLKDEIAVLRGKAQKASRTFNMTEIAHFSNGR